MNQQISKKNNVRESAFPIGDPRNNPAAGSTTSLPFYLAIVVPRELKDNTLWQANPGSTLTLSAYWLLTKSTNHLQAPKDNLLQSQSQGSSPSSSDKSDQSLPSFAVQHLEEVLTESLLEDLWISSADDLSSWQESWRNAGFSHWAEKQFLPGVTDNLAHIVEEALTMQDPPLTFKVASGKIYLFRSGEAFLNPEYNFYHPLVERFRIHDLSSSAPTRCFTFPAVTLSYPPAVESINLEVGRTELLNISKERLLALSLEEMETIKAYYNRSEIKLRRVSADLPLCPTDVELEIIAQTWSEHCKHKIFNASIEMKEINNSGGVQIYKVKSLYRSFIQKATKDLQDKRKDLLSVFKDNSGIVKWNDQYAICFKVETHNSPSALEPYGGALTGILGVNRDILGTGLGAKPIFNTDILCFAYPSETLAKRPKLLPSEVIMEGVRKGIQDGGNKSGIPTVNGAIVFHSGYRAKPLVFCGTGGLLPLEVAGLCAYEKHTQCGDTVVMAGGRVGKDGIHGATFSSEALHEGSPVTAVQIGDPFTQKRLLDFVLAARDEGLITGITDNGAGGLSSSVGEMATLTGGAEIDLDCVPTKYPGLAAWEIVISESQERMTISTSNFVALQTLANKYHVEVSAIGHFNDCGQFVIRHKGKLAASLDLEFLHKGVPELRLQAEWSPCSLEDRSSAGMGKHQHSIQGAQQGDRNNIAGGDALTKNAMRQPGRPRIGAPPSSNLMSITAAVNALSVTEAKPAKDALSVVAELPTIDIYALLLKILAHPNVCSRESVIRQYDHEVQGGNVVKPLMGESQLSACDAAVITPILGDSAGLVISNGLCPQLGQFDPYLMAQASLDEAIRNAICVGADPTSISILDNFCWPDPVASENNPNGKKYLGMLVKSCQGLYEAALTMQTPLISGKDSMKNDFDDGVVRLSVPPTLLISAIGKVPDINFCITSEFKTPGDQIFLLSAGKLGLAGSILSDFLYRDILSAGTSPPPTVICSLNLEDARLLYRDVHQAILNIWINSAHDLSEGGMAVALAESIIGSGLGANISLNSILASHETQEQQLTFSPSAFSALLNHFEFDTIPAADQLSSAPASDELIASLLFSEGPGQIIVTVSAEHKDNFLDHFARHNVIHLGEVTNECQLEINLGIENNGQRFKWPLHELRNAWKTPLPFA